MLQSAKAFIRQVLKKFVRIIFLLLTEAYGGNLEFAWSLQPNDLENNKCGKFPAIVILISKYDHILESHTVTALSKK